jgi:hypothetical protein
MASRAQISDVDVLALLAARKEDARVFVRNGRLVIQSQGQLPPDVLAGLQAHRDRLVEILTLASPPQAPLCRLCGRTQHEADYVCPEPPPADAQYPVAPGWPGLAAAIAAILAAEVPESMAEAA